MGVFLIYIVVVIIIAVISLSLAYLIRDVLRYKSSKAFVKKALASWSKKRKRRLCTLSAIVFFILIYSYIFIPQYNFLNTTKAEKALVLPDEDFLETPKMKTMHGVTIDASPDEVWKWLVQVGGYRAGWYSITWAENLFGMGIYNNYEIRPEWQILEEGQLLIYNRKGDVGVVTDVVKDKYFVHRWDCYDDDSKFGTYHYARTGEDITLRNWEVFPGGIIDSGLRCSWALYIEELPDGKCRLLSRTIVDWTNPNPFLNIFLRSILPTMHDIMDVEMLKQIKNCAEGNAHKYKNSKLPKGGAF